MFADEGELYLDDIVDVERSMTVFFNIQFQL